MLETVFPGIIRTADYHQDEEENQEQGAEVYTQGSSSESGYGSDQTSEDSGSDGDAPDQQEQLTYVPVQPSTFGETDSEEQEEELEESENQDEDSEEDYVNEVTSETTADQSTGDEPPPPSGGYNLRTRKDINYTMRALSLIHI